MPEHIAPTDLADPVGPGSPSALPRELPLVGRKDDLERLYRIFGDRTRVEPMILLSGDAGVGKSRLARTVADEARRRGWTVAAGQAYPIETGMPYSLLSDAFLPILRRFDEATLTVLTRGTSGDLRRLFPALGGAEVPEKNWDPEESRTRLFWSFTEFLKRLAERGPLLIVAEDLHWADASSLSLLHFLARRIESEPIQILATYSRSYGRDPDGPTSPAHALGSLGLQSLHQLAPLTAEDTEELLRTLFQVGRAPLREFAARLYEWTQGNPYFIAEILETLVRSGHLHHRDGTWLGWDARHIGLPSSVRDALLKRLRRLSPDARTAADLVAVGGGRASVRLLGLVGELPDERLLEAVEELVSEGFADESEEDDQVILELRHPMLRETLYTYLGPTRRRLLHRRLAERLEALHERGAAPVDQLAYHFARGGQTGEDTRAARYLAEAGRSALARHADGEAVAYLEAALERYRAASDDERPAFRAEDLEAELARGLARLGRYGDAATIWSALLAAAREAQDAVGAAEALRHLGLLSFWSGRHAEALSRYDEALDVLRSAPGADVAGPTEPPRATREARIHLAAGVALQELGRAEEARARIERSLDLARTLDDAMLLGRAHRALALLFTWIGRTEDARRHGWQAVELADRARDAYVRFWGRWALASLEGLTGNTSEMTRLLGQAGQVADELRSPVLRLWTAELEVEYAYAVGDWDGALARGEQAISLATVLSQTTLLPRLLVWTATVYLGRGDLTRGREMVDRAWSLAGLDDGGAHARDVHVVVPAHIGAAACLLAEERYDEAVAVGEAGLELADRAGYVFWSLHRLLPIVAEAHIRRRDLDSAAAAGRRLREHGQRFGHRLATAWADTCEALVLWVSGDVERGLGLLQAAAPTLEAIPMRYDAARIRRQIAGRLGELDRREEALAELRHVHEVLGELGARPELDRCRDMFRELAARPPLRPDPGHATSLTRREREIARLAAGRVSAKAIARELDISPRTVTTHLTNIYRKLGIGSRGELIDLSREARIPEA